MAASVLFTLACGLAAAAWMRAHGVTVSDVYAELRRGDSPRFSWRSVAGKHWQALESESEPRFVDVKALERAETLGCPAGMVRVKGAYHAGTGQGSAEVERLQDASCVEWLNKDFPARCNVFDPEKIAAGLGRIATRPVDVCVDRFEYPNVAGENPIIVVTFREAESMCKGSGKRLCTEDEWTFACEGEDAWPYPYGFTRDPGACVVDRAWRPFTEGALSPRDGRGAREELDRLWQGEPSGARPACKSPFGVYDLTGNVDEWTRSSRSSGYASILKGGYWGPVRARCRPSTRAHGEDFVAYQQGFRCCANPDLTAEPPLDGEADEPDGQADEPDASVLAPAEVPGAPALEPAPARASNDDPVDELEALARTRAGLRCDAARAGRSRAAAIEGEAMPFLGILAFVLVARRRAGRAPRDPERTRARRP